VRQANTQIDLTGLRPADHLGYRYVCYGSTPAYRAEFDERQVVAINGCLARRCLRPMRQKHLAAEPVLPSKWAKHRGPRAAVRPGDEHLALGAYDETNPSSYGVKPCHEP